MLSQKSGGVRGRLAPTAHPTIRYFKIAPTTLLLDPEVEPGEPGVHDLDRAAFNRRLGLRLVVALGHQLLALEGLPAAFAHQLLALEGLPAALTDDDAVLAGLV